MRSEARHHFLPYILDFSLLPIDLSSLQQSLGKKKDCASFLKLVYIFKGYYMSMKILHLLNTYNGATKFGKVKGTT